MLPLLSVKFRWPFQVTLMGQLRFDIAPYAEAFKRGVIPDAREDIIISLEEVFAGCTKRLSVYW